MAAALAPAVQPTLSGSAWSLGQDTGGQQIGGEVRDASDIGIPEVLPQPWDDGPLLPSLTPAGNAGAIETTGLDYLGAEYGGTVYDTTPWPNYAGDPDLSANLTYVTHTGDTTWGEDDTSGATSSGHDYDQGVPKALRKWGHPDIGMPEFQHYQMQSTDQQPVFSPNGQMVELPGSREANVMNYYNDANVDEGIGYYVQETERPFYSQIAQVPGEYDGPGGQDQPDNRYSAWVYNDGGIPEAYVAPSDAPVIDQAAPNPMVLDNMGYGGSY